MGSKYITITKRPQGFLLIVLVSVAVIIMDINFINTYDFGLDEAVWPFYMFAGMFICLAIISILLYFIMGEEHKVKVE